MRSKYNSQDLNANPAMAISSIGNEAKQSKGTIRSLIKLMAPYILQHKWTLIVVLLLVFISNILLLLVPRYTGKIVDLIGFGKDNINLNAVGFYCILILIISLVGWGLECLRNIAMVRISQSIVFKLRQDVFDHLIRLPLSFLESSTKGDMISRISVDIDQLSETITSDVITVLTGVVTVIGALAMMISISPLLSLVFSVMIPVIMIAARIISRRSRKLFRFKKMNYGLLCAHAEEMISAQKTVKLFGMESYNQKQYELRSAEYKSTGQRAEFSSSMMMPTMNFLNNISFLLISISGCLLFLNGGISIGNISSFIVYSKKFSGPIVETANLYNTFQSALASCDRINFLLSTPIEKDILLTDKNNTFAAENIQKVGFRGDVEVSHVNFSYIPGVPTIQDLSFHAHPGEKIAIVGETGSGKTTITNLLLRFYEAESGSIKIDGVDIGAFSLTQLRRAFGLVLQENFIFEASVAQNVDYGAQCQDLSRIKHALDEVGLGEFIDNLPKGCDTKLSSDSDFMSQGQKQLLTIARTLMMQPAMFIFDEATSSVDTKTEQNIKVVMDRIMEGHTAFIIAHRLSTILSADRILVMDHGRLVESGTHKQLLKKRGVYYEMYQSQFASI